MEDTYDVHQEAADPAQAFDDLRSEVSVLRRAVEALPGQWQEHQAPDYSLDLGRMTRDLANIAQSLNGIKAHPTLQMTLEQHAQAMAKAGEALMWDASQTLAQATQKMEAEHDQLARLVGTSRKKSQQRRWLIYTAAGVFVLGVSVSPVIARYLPFGLGSYVAAFTMKAERWDAGVALLKASYPDSWRQVAEHEAFMKAHQKVIDGCKAAAAKKHLPQTCPILVTE